MLVFLIRMICFRLRKQAKDGTIYYNVISDTNFMEIRSRLENHLFNLKMD